MLLVVIKILVGIIKIRQNKGRMVKILKDIIVKISSFFSRAIRYFVFSTLISFSVCTILVVANLFMGVRVSLGFYMLLSLAFDFALTTLICIYNGHKLFLPINKPLIMKLERERVERARQSKKRQERKYKKKISQFVYISTAFSCAFLIEILLLIAKTFILKANKYV